MKALTKAELFQFSFGQLAGLAKLSSRTAKFCSWFVSEPSILMVKFSIVMFRLLSPFWAVTEFFGANLWRLAIF